MKCTTRQYAVLALAAVLCLSPTLAAPGPKAALTISGTGKVIDGDTLTVSGVRVRLEGIDAPEMRQTCSRRESGSWQCGEESARALARMVEGRIVVCTERGADKYRRMLGVCFMDGHEINAEMVRQGLAWAFVKYSHAYVAVEAEARTRRLGVWQGEAMPAWEFRRRAWVAAEPAAPDGCAIKGNISRHGRLYHMPWSPWYEATSIDPARGERWFCSEAEAVAAGWRRASVR